VTVEESVKLQGSIRSENSVHVNGVHITKYVPLMPDPLYACDPHLLTVKESILCLIELHLPCFERDS
jgi:hypothetical protein